MYKRLSRPPGHVKGGAKPGQREGTWRMWKSKYRVVVSALLVATLLVVVTLHSTSRLTPALGSSSTILSGNGLNVPKGMAVVGTQVWVANAGNSTISRFNQDGTSAGNPLSGNGLNGPRGGAVVNSQVWIPNTSNSTISLFNTSGTSAGGPLSGNGLDGPEAAAVIGGAQVWVPNYGGNSVSVFSLAGTSAGTPLSGNGLTNPHAVAAVGAQVWV